MINNLKFLLPIIIIFSSLRIFGYVTAFLFYIPYILKNKSKIIEVIKKSNFTEKANNFLLYFPNFSNYPWSLFYRRYTHIFILDPTFSNYHFCLF